MSTTTGPDVDHLSGWAELRRAVDQLELEIHLGTMEARDRWRSFRPQLERMGHALATEIKALAETIRGLRDGIDHADS